MGQLPWIHLLDAKIKSVGDPFLRFHPTSARIFMFSEEYRRLMHGLEKVADEICLYGQVGFLARVQYKCKERLFQSTLLFDNRVDDILTG